KALRVLTENDLERCFEIFKKFVSNLELIPIMTFEEFSHWILPRDKVIYSYVMENDLGEIIDFVSFFSLPSSVLDNDLHSHINVGYLFYYGISEGSSLEELMQALLYKAKEEGFDVFNALDIMQNQSFFKPLNFAMGDGCLHYYL